MTGVFCAERLADRARLVVRARVQRGDLVAGRLVVGVARSWLGLARRRGTRGGRVSTPGRGSRGASRASSPARRSSARRGRGRSACSRERRAGSPSPRRRRRGRRPRPGRGTRPSGAWLRASVSSCVTLLVRCRWPCGCCHSVLAATLADIGRSTAEQRRTDTHVCRAVSDGRLEVTAHAGRDRVGARMRAAHLLGQLGEPCERRIGVGADRARPPSRPAGAARRARRSGRPARPAVGRATPPRSGSSSRLTWTNTSSGRRVRAAPTASASARDQLRPVDRVHRAGVADHRARLVASVTARRSATAGATGSNAASSSASSRPWPALPDPGSRRCRARPSRARVATSVAG